MSFRILDIIFDRLSADPGSPEEGHAWYNDTDKRLKFRDDSATRVVSRKDELDTHEGTANPHGTTLDNVLEAGATAARDINMGGFKITNAATDTSPSSLATNQKVDDKIRAGLSGWDPQESVLDKDVLDPTPLTPSEGHRYLINGTGAGAWAGHDYEIAEWVSGAWYYTSPSVGMHTFVEDESRKYEYVGGSWQYFEETHDHGELIGLTDIADHPGYLDLGGTRPMTGGLNMNGHNITTGVGTVDGVDVSDHSARHDPGGADALTTAAPTQGIGGGNTEGTANSFARSNHDHTIRETNGPTDLTVGAITDGQFVKRSGTSLIGANRPGIKSGRVAAGTFAGNPKTATVTFGSAFASANYSVQLTVEGTVSFAPRVTTPTTGGFVINMGANNINGLVNTHWIAIPDGEY